MKIVLSGVFLLMTGVHISIAQTPPPSAIRLNNGGVVSNTIIYQNRSLIPISSGVQVNFSASDSVQAGTGNKQLLSSPFTTGFRIGSTGYAYNNGTNNDVNISPIDSLDLDYAARVNCQKIDMGAYEIQVPPTNITTEPVSDTTCEGTPTQLTVSATGHHVTYQWFKNGEILLGQTSSILPLSGNISDSGTYNVIAFGDCCNDTSIDVRVHVDRKPALTAMPDTSILSPSDVQLYTISSIGTVQWYTGDFVPISDLLISNIQQTQYYFAVAKNGACVDSVRADVALIVKGHQCMVNARPDTTLCYGDSYFLQADSASVNYHWLIYGSTDTLPKLSWFRPDSTQRLVVKGQNEVGMYCYDTLTITVRKVDLEVMDDLAVCGQSGGTEIQLISTPAADGWYYEDGGFIGSGNKKLFVENKSTSIFIAKRSDDLCTVEKRVTVTSNPPNLKIFPQDTTICEGEFVNLTTNVNPATVIWTKKSDGSPVSETLVNPNVSTIYTASVLDALCGDVSVDVAVNVQAKPAFEVMLPKHIYENTPFALSASPNVSWWTDLAGTRVFMPFTLNVASDFIGWYTSGVCTVSDTVHVTVSKDTFEVLVISGNGCFDGDGWAEVSVDGETAPYTFLWDNGSTESFTNGLNAGIHSISVTNNNQKVISKTFTIASVEPLQTGYTIVEPNNAQCSGGRIEINPSGGTQPYDFEWRRQPYDVEWSENSIGQNLYDVQAGIYRLVIRDAEYCTDTTTILLPCLYRQVMPTLFITPDGNGKNDVLKIENIEYYPNNRVIILNAYGEEVSKLYNYDNKSIVWNGRNKTNQILPDGVYYYIVEANGVKPMVGWLLMKLSKHK